MKSFHENTKGKTETAASGNEVIRSNPPERLLAMARANITAPETKQPAAKRMVLIRCVGESGTPARRMFR